MGFSHVCTGVLSCRGEPSLSLSLNTHVPLHVTHPPTCPPQHVPPRAQGRRPPAARRPVRGAGAQGNRAAAALRSVGPPRGHEQPAFCGPHSPFLPGGSRDTAAERGNCQQPGPRSCFTLNVPIRTLRPNHRHWPHIPSTPSLTCIVATGDRRDAHALVHCVRWHELPTV